MKMLVVHRKLTLSLFVMLMLIWGVSGMSYGQEEDAITISITECDANEVPSVIDPHNRFIRDALVTVKGTIRANRTVEDVRVWLTINGNKVGPIPHIFGGPLIPGPGGKWLGDLSAGETKSFSVTEREMGGVSDGDTCGVSVEWREVNPPPQTDPTPAQPPRQQDEPVHEPPEETSSFCRVGDVLSPGESCKDPGSGNTFSVLEDGAASYLGATFRTNGGSVNLLGFRASPRANGRWEIKSVTGGGTPQPPIQEPDPDRELVLIPDANLAAMIREELGLTSGSPITKLDMLDLKLLVVSGDELKIEKRIKDLTGLEHATNLEILTLQSHEIRDIAPFVRLLARLPKLKHLGLNYNNISDITPLSGLTKLQGLYLHDNNISDITPLSGLTELQRLELSANQIHDVSPLKGLVNLQWLALSGNPIQEKVPLFALLRKNPEVRIWLDGDEPLSLSDAPPTRPKADVNADGTVNIADLVLVASNLGKTGQNAADVNGDGQVNIADLVLVANALGNAPAAPALHPDALEMLTSADVRLWLSEARHLRRTDATAHRGVLFLEQLLAALIPKETALLANYPNPFNPETWIPYQLAKDAEVTLTIYAMNGHVVRRLTLGHQPAGVYQNRRRAAYWDGRNAVGEPVASGIYFYTFTAGDFTATRKMLIRK